MKNSLFTFLLLLITPLVFALPVSNPEDVALYDGKFRTSNCCDSEFKVLGSWCNSASAGLSLGYYGDFVFDRHLRNDTSGFGDHRLIQKTRINTNAICITANIFEMLDFYATAGTSKIYMFAEDVAWQPTGFITEGNLVTDTHFSWSLGGRALLYSCGCLSFGVEGQYFQFKPHLEHFIQYGVGGFNYFNKHNQITYSEWQAGGVVAYNVQINCPNIAFVPYFGVKWSHAHIETHNFQFILEGSTNVLTIFDLVSNKNWGYAVGATFAVCNKVGLTVEGRFADEKALYVSSRVCF